MNARREAVVAGQFYPADEKELQRYFETFNDWLRKRVPSARKLAIKTRAVIVPHAGYVYSGFTANAAYRLLKNADLKRVLVIGPSHRVYLPGTSVGMFDAYATPLGALKGDTALAKEIAERFGLGFYPDAHAEHSTETQFPFLKYYLPDVNTVELVYGDERPQKLADVIGWALRDEKTGVVISTDLSHFYSLAEAKRLDGVCLEAVAELDVTRLREGCEACGKIGMEAMMEAAKALGMEPLVLDYRTSADASGDESRVVGYMSAAFLG